MSRPVSTQYNRKGHRRSNQFPSPEMMARVRAEQEEKDREENERERQIDAALAKTMRPRRYKRMMNVHAAENRPAENMSLEQELEALEVSDAADDPAAAAATAADASNIQEVVDSPQTYAKKLRRRRNVLAQIRVTTNLPCNDFEKYLRSIFPRVVQIVRQQFAQRHGMKAQLAMLIEYEKPEVIEDEIESAEAAAG